MVENKKRGVLYLRVSTQHQDYELQRKQLIDLFNFRGIEIVNIFEEKRTGTDDERPEFQKLLCLTKEDIDYVGVWSVDRLSRKMSTMIKTIETFNSKKICILTVKENLQSLDEDLNVSKSTLTLLGIYSSFAEIERINLIERTREGRRNRIIDGKLPYTPKPPIGYKVVNRKVVIDEVKSQTVKEIYQDYLDGWGMMSLSKAYNINISDIKKILHNETYTGKARTKLLEGMVFEIPQIIEEDTFNKVQDIIKQRRNKSGRKGKHNPLSRKIRCGCCGRHIINYTDSKKGYIYYRCNRPCQQVNVQERDIRHLIESVMNKHIQEYKKNNKDKKITKDKIKELKKKISHITKIVKTLTNQKSELNEKIDILKTHLSIDKLKEKISRVRKIQESIQEHKKEIMRLKQDVEYYERLLETQGEKLEVDVDKVIEEHLTDMVLYKLNRNRYKYFRMEIDGMYKYEGVFHTTTWNKIIHNPGIEGYLFEVTDKGEVCVSSNGKILNYKDIMDGKEEL